MNCRSSLNETLWCDSIGPQKMSFGMKRGMVLTWTRRFLGLCDALAVEKSTRCPPVSNFRVVVGISVLQKAVKILQAAAGVFRC